MSVNWSWSIGAWMGGQPQYELASATARGLHFKLLDPSDATFTIQGDSLEANNINELISDLWVYRDGVDIFRGRCMSTVDTLDESGNHTVAVSASDYRQVLDRRIRPTDRTWTSVEQSTIAWDAITDMQAELGGALGITQGTWPTTGIVRPSVIVSTGDTIWSFIKHLGAMDGGFEFDISPLLQASLYWPRRGQDVGTVLDYGGIASAVTRTFDPSLYANAVHQSGATGVTAYDAVVADIASRPEGRWSAAIGDTQLTTADMVQQSAAHNLQTLSLPVPAYSVTLEKGAWGGPSHCWLGDYVNIVINHGRLNERVSARVYEITITLDATNEETVVIGAGDIAVRPKSIMRGIARRVAVLSRR